MPYLKRLKEGTPTPQRSLRRCSEKPVRSSVRRWRQIFWFNISRFLEPCNVTSHIMNPPIFLILFYFSLTDSKRTEIGQLILKKLFFLYKNIPSFSFSFFFFLSNQIASLILRLPCRQTKIHFFINNLSVCFKPHSSKPCQVGFQSNRLLPLQLFLHVSLICHTLFIFS